MIFLLAVNSRTAKPSLMDSNSSVCVSGSFTQLGLVSGPFSWEKTQYDPEDARSPRSLLCRLLQYPLDLKAKRSASSHVCGHTVEQEHGSIDTITADSRTSHPSVHAFWKTNRLFKDGQGTMCTECALSTLRHVLGLVFLLRAVHGQPCTDYRW